MDEILFEKLPGKAGNLGVVTLNRPKALNALTHAMIQALSDRLEVWLEDETVKAVLVQSAAEKAFCAGGDILYVYENKNKIHLAEAFFKDEYCLNQKIHKYPKPYIVFLDGLTMGGGVGISVHGSHRIGTENCLLSMPEAGIGFFPDVGASYFLSRLEKNVGVYLGLTGARLKANTALQVGLIDYAISREQLKQVKQSLLTTSFDFGDRAVVSSILKQNAHSIESPEEDELPVDLIQAIFSSESVEEIFAALAGRSEPFSQEVLRVLKTKSPTSLKVIRREMLDGKSKNIGDCFAMEYHIARCFLQGPDFFEGIRAAIVDKDRNPHWNPPMLDGVTQERVDEFFTY